MIAQLRGQGYRISVVESTWLGRVRVVALRDGARREIVFDPRNGAILRDYTSGGGRFGSGPSAGGSGGRDDGHDGGDDDDGGGDDDDDDDSDDDNDDDDDDDD